MYMFHGIEFSAVKKIYEKQNAIKTVKQWRVVSLRQNVNFLL